VLRPGILKSFGWRVFDVLSKDWYEEPEKVLLQIDAALTHANRAVPLLS